MGSQVLWRLGVAFSHPFCPFCHTWSRATKYPGSSCTAHVSTKKGILPNTPVWEVSSALNHLCSSSHLSCHTGCKGRRHSLNTRCQNLNSNKPLNHYFLLVVPGLPQGHRDFSKPGAVFVQDGLIAMLLAAQGCTWQALFHALA